MFESDFNCTSCQDTFRKLVWGRGKQEFGAKVFRFPEFMFLESRGFCFWVLSVFEIREGFGGSEEHALG